MKKYHLTFLLIVASIFVFSWVFEQDKKIFELAAFRIFPALFIAISLIGYKGKRLLGLITQNDILEILYISLVASAILMIISLGIVTFF